MRAPARRLNVPLVAAAVATAVCTLLVAVDAVPGLATFERKSVDARFALRGARQPADDRIVIVGIDDETMRRHPELTQTRRGWAALVDALAAARPQVIAIDAFFSSREIILPDELADRVRETHDALAGDSDPGAQHARDTLGAVVEELRGDEVLAASIQAAGNVYLGMFFDTDEPGALADAEAPGTAPARFGESVVAGGANQPPFAGAAVATRPDIGAGAAGGGFTNIVADPDGTTRRMPLVVQQGERHYMPLALAAVLAAEGSADSEYVGGRDALAAGGHTYPLGPHASAMLDFVGPSGAFPRVSAADILDGTAPPDALAGKIAFVGFTYGAYDKVATPFDPLTDGVELHATLAENLLHDRLMRPGGRAITLVAIVLLGAIVTALQLRPARRRAWVPASAAVALLATWATFVYVRFSQGVVMEAVAPLCTTLATALIAGLAALATEGREKWRLRAAFSQYVSSALVERILASPALLGGERRELTVLFSDIRGFSKLAESLDPEELARFLNEYLTPMTEIVLDSSGTLDKYIGDAVMAIWGAPVDVTDHAERACGVALAMLERLARMNAGWKASGKPQIAIGIGINTGTMAVGNMGSEARFDYTVLGDAVNLGARLEALTKEYAVDVLVGESTARAAAARFAFREIDWVRVKGREGSAPVFELCRGEIDPRYAEALAAYRARDFALAIERWGDLALAGDRTAAIMRDRAEALRADPPPPDWDGVYEQRSK